MIVFKIILFTTAVLVQVVNCEDPTYTVGEDLYIPIYEIKYRVGEEKIPQVLPDLVIGNSYVNNTQFREVLEKLNINVDQLFMIQLIEIADWNVLFEESQIELSAFLRLIISKVPNPRQNLRTILQLLNIDYDSFMDAYTYGEDGVLYNLLNNATYDEVVLTEVFKLANTSLEELIILVQKEIVEPVIRKPFKECLNVFGENQLRNLLQQSLKEIKVSNIVNDSLIHELLTNFTNTLNTQTIWAVHTKDGVVSIPRSYHVWKNQENHVEAYLENVQNQTITTAVVSLSLEPGKTFSVIQTESNKTLFESNIIISKDYATQKDVCVFLTKSNGKLNVVTATDYHQNDLFIHINYFGSDFNLGSPFICDGNDMYGMLTKQNNGMLDFLIVGEIPNTSDENHNISFDYENDDDVHDGATTIKHLCYCIVITFVAMLL